jgi:hypothetical protein
LTEWFDKLGAQPRERTDLYLRLVETDMLGVKLRSAGGALEFKARECTHGRRELYDRIHGRVEEWRKWSFPTTGTGPSTPRLGLPPNLWIEVGKVRQLASHEPPGWEPWVEEARRGDGCSVELTEVRAAGEAWSTLGFEAFGSEGTILPSLGRATRAFFGQLELPHGLAAEASCGYPGWFRKIGWPLQP